VRKALRDWRKDKNEGNEYKRIKSENKNDIRKKKEEKGKWKRK